MGKSNFIRRVLKPLLQRAGIDIVRYIPPIRHAPAPASKDNVNKNELLTKLKQIFPYPDPDPSIQPFLWSLDGGGKELIEEWIGSHDVRYVLEIGSFLGGSTEHWLRASPKVVVVCVDPWQDGWAGTYAVDNGFPKFQEQLNRKDGFFYTFLANLNNYRDRIIPVRDQSPEVLVRFFLMGLDPQVVFFDATKLSDDIVVSHRLWPDAILAGDDWHWGENEGYPVQKMVKDFAAANGFQILQKFDTWMMVK